MRLARCTHPRPCPLPLPLPSAAIEEAPEERSEEGGSGASGGGLERAAEQPDQPGSESTDDVMQRRIDDAEIGGYAS